VAAKGFAEVPTAYDPNPVNPSNGAIQAEVTSPYCGELVDAGAGNVFRNDKGAIVGGSFAFSVSNNLCRPGAKTSTFTIDQSTPSGVDRTRTQVSAYCDLPNVPGRKPA
jgi:hypothetical protein